MYASLIGVSFAPSAGIIVEQTTLFVYKVAACMAVIKLFIDGN